MLLLPLLLEFSDKKQNFVDSIDAVQANKEAALTVLASKVAAQLALLENNLKAADAADQDEDATAEK